MDSRSSAGKNYEGHLLGFNGCRGGYTASYCKQCASLSRSFMLTRVSCKYGAPDQNSLPTPPLHWVHSDDWPELLSSLNLGRFLSKHMQLYLKWFTSATDSRPLEDIVGIWKANGLTVPGGAVWDDVEARKLARLKKVKDENETPLEVQRHIIESYGKQYIFD